ncbi:hypothetical protein IW139_001519 [Coemansia sp. RSA 353]|nr:hypothetical protein GGH15_001409 [Coemansia sp. RSA 562]KAJ2174833.1 hypothetical protein GGH16_001097 [Coemansia sp. RSA 560]KAJ2196447.1 hypothetical protein IW144_002918 [Coemansia sp. RSA 522]KAJ2205420.1 hypothetical protein IW145_002805 [Coemansia sp. RSA 521]KAJ2299771.1 hypothetical protein IW139_001519 [Coemansia sp. RSA 353]
MVIPAAIPENAVYELTPVDGNPSSRANLQFVLFYKTDGNKRSTASQSMRDAYYQVLSHYPILYGQLERKVDEQLGNTKVQVSVSKEMHSTCMPSYTEFDVDELVSDIQEANYNWATWPQPLLSICPVRRPSTDEKLDDPLAQCVVTWHADGMGLLISVDHSIADGVGIDILLNQWAGATRAALSSDNTEPSMLELPVDYDHASLYKELCHEEPQKDWFVEYVDSVDLAQAPTEIGAIMDSDTRSPASVELALRAHVHSLRILPSALHKLYAEMHPSATTRHIPVIRLVYALMWQCFADATSLDAQPNASCFLNVIHSARKLVNRPHYIGNAVCPVYMRQTAAQLHTSTRQLAQTIGNNMHAVSGPHWLATLLMLQDSERYKKFLTVFANPRAKQLTVSNISRLRFFSVDFGWGAPVHATVYPMLIPGFATWLPLGASGGLYILWNMPDSVAERLKNDPRFTRYVEFLF